MAPRNDRPVRDRSIMLAGFPAPLRRAWGVGLLGLTLWLPSFLALFPIGQWFRWLASAAP